MELFVLEENEKQKIEQVKDNKDYLNFVTFDFKHWMAVDGKINNVSFISRDGVTWDKLGKGRISELTANKLYKMNNYFRRG